MSWTLRNSDKPRSATSPNSDKPRSETPGPATSRNPDHRQPRRDAGGDPFGAGDEGSGESGEAGPQRLQKVMAGAGLGSRRACEELIAAGRVSVDGKVAQLGDRADPATSVIYVDGERVVTNTRLVYLALNKPRGVVSTMSDERGRTGIAEILGASVSQRVFHVGRLDTDSEGLLLLTNDGELAHRLTHPSYGVSKTYLAEVTGAVAR